MYGFLAKSNKVTKVTGGHTPLYNSRRKHVYGFLAKSNKVTKVTGGHTPLYKSNTLSTNESIRLYKSNKVRVTLPAKTKKEIGWGYPPPGNSRYFVTFASGKPKKKLGGGIPPREIRVTLLLSLKKCKIIV